MRKLMIALLLATLSRIAPMFGGAQSPPTIQEAQKALNTKDPAWSFVFSDTPVESGGDLKPFSFCKDLGGGEKHCCTGTYQTMFGGLPVITSIHCRDDYDPYWNWQG